MSSWLTISEVCDITGIADPTLRRYIKTYEDYIRTSRDGHVLIIAEESVNVIQKIREYSLDKRWGTDRIKRELRENYPMTFIIGQDSEKNEVSVGQTLDEMRKMVVYLKKLSVENQALKHEIEEMRKDLEILSTQQERHEKNSIELLREMRADMRRRDEKSGGWFSWMRKKRDNENE